MSLYSLDDYVINERTRTAVDLQNAVRPFCSPDKAWWKARREYFPDVLVPAAGGGDKEMYVYVKIPANEIWVFAVATVRAAITSNPSTVASRVLQGEVCYFISEDHLKRWGVTYWILPVTSIEAAILHGPWAAA